MHSAFSPFKLLSSMTLQYLQGAHQDVSEEKERSEASWRASMSWARQLGISCLHFILTQFQWQNALTNLQLIDCRGSPRRCKIRKMPKQKQNTKWFNLGCVLFSGRLTHTVATADCVKGNLSWTRCTCVLPKCIHGLHVLASFSILDAHILGTVTLGAKAPKVSSAICCSLS